MIDHARLPVLLGQPRRRRRRTVCITTARHALRARVISERRSPVDRHKIPAGAAERISQRLVLRLPAATRHAYTYVPCTHYGA